MQINFQEILDKILDSPVPVLAIIVSLVSLTIAYQSKAIAKRALKINEKAYEDKQSNFDLYLIDGFRYKKNDEEKKVILFNVTINNKSDTKNTFKAILEIEYAKTNEKAIKVLINHDPHLCQIPSMPDLNSYDQEIRLDEKHIESKWLFFQEPVAPFDQYRIKKYSVIISDNKHKAALLETYILKNII